jgi:nucleotide-binding universal stress UspA family protein
MSFGEARRLRITVLTTEEREDQMFHHILFPVDFSERCKQAVPFVKQFAKRHCAKVTLMHVIQIPSGWYGGADAAYPITFDVDAMEDDARDELVRFYAAPNGSEPRNNVAETVTHGEPAHAIVQYAEQNGVDLIMMPTHGYGMFRRLLVGSVTARVLHDAHCAVWTAAHAEKDCDRSPECREILCAIDGTEKSIPVIRDAVMLGRELSAKVRLVHATPIIYPNALVAESQEFYIGCARQLICELQRKAGTNLELWIDTGNVSDVVRRAAIYHDVDLIVIGCGKVHERFGGLRTNVYAIIRDSPCPVLSV